MCMLQVAFPSLEELHISYLEDTSNIWGKHSYNDKVSFCQLKRILVSNCNNLKFVIPLAKMSRLRNLECLSIYSCSSLISEVGTYNNNTVACALVALRDMDLVDLPCLTKTELNSRDHSGAMTLYPNLENLKIQDCNNLRNVFLASIARDLMHLKKMCVIRCSVMSEIIGAGGQQITDGIIFPELTVVQLNLLPKLTRFRRYQSRETNTDKVHILHNGSILTFSLFNHIT